MSPAALCHNFNSVVIAWLAPEMMMGLAYTQQSVDTVFWRNGADVVRAEASGGERVERDWSVNEGGERCPANNQTKARNRNLVDRGCRRKWGLGTCKA